MRLIDERTGIKQASRLMHSKQFISLVAACCLPLGAAAQDAPVPTNAPAPPANARMLSLQDCIQLALQHNLDIQIQRYNPIISQYTLNIAFAGYEPTFNFSAVRGDNSSPGGINSITGLPFSSIDRASENFNAGLTGILPTGLTYNFTGPLSKQNQSSGTNVIPTTWSASPGVTLTQPLLKNFWIDNTRLQIQLDKAAVKLSEQALLQQIMTSVTSVKTAYYNLMYDRENVTNNLIALQLAQQLADENKKKVEVGTLAPLDETQAESQAASSRAALLTAEQTVAVQENALKVLLSDTYGDWADVALIPSEALTAVPQTPDLQASLRHAVAQRPDLVEQRLKLDQENVTLRYTKNQLFPELDVIASYGRNAFNTGFGNTLNDVANGNNPFYTFGAQITIPLGNSSAVNNHKTSQATLNQTLLQYKQLEQNAVYTIRNDVGQVRSTLQQVDATRAARVYAQDALDAERKKLENGKSTSFQVLQLISNLTAAKSAEIQALANYNIAIAQLSLDEGSTLEKDRIDVRMK